MYKSNDGATHYISYKLFEGIFSQTKNLKMSASSWLFGHQYISRDKVCGQDNLAVLIER